MTLTLRGITPSTLYFSDRAPPRIVGHMSTTDFVDLASVEILLQHEFYGHDRFLVQFTIGGIPHAGILRSIKLLDREVAPAVRDELARQRAAAV